MILNLSPCRMDAVLIASVAGETITLNGQAVDLSGVAEGAEVNAAAFGCDWITGTVTRTGGVLHLTIILPHAADAPEATLWPAPIDARDGPVALPSHLNQPPEPELS